MGGNILQVLEQALAGDRRALGRVLSVIDDHAPEAETVIRQIATRAVRARAHVVGFTGAPGAGKSTLVARVAGHYQQLGARVAVLAVDPSSPFSGGAILGDRIRMGQLAEQGNVFIRSLASRGQAGGLSRSAAQAVKLFAAAGFDPVIVETVGAGQADLEIMDCASTVVLVLVPGLGDEMQALKAGILEIADIFAVNKADRDGADQVVAELEMLLSLKAANGWRPPIRRTVALTGEGVAELVEGLLQHRKYLAASGEEEVRRRRRAAAELRALLLEKTLALLDGLDGQQQWQKALDGVAGGELDPYTAVTRLLETLRETR